MRWLALAALSAVGGGASAYLTYSRYVDRPTECAGIGSCEAVQTSEYSEVLGVPVALLGLLFFIALGGLAVARLTGGERRLFWAEPAVFAATLGGLVSSPTLLI